MIEEMEPDFGWWEGDCAGCAVFGPVNDNGLCAGCAPKLERDLIRNREWAYSAAAFGLNEKQCEDMRRQIVKEFGERLELIAPSQAKDNGPNRKRRKRKQKKRNKAGGNSGHNAGNCRHSRQRRQAG